MGERSVEQTVRDLDTRVERIEQILPTLATKADLAAAVAPLATRAEMLAEGEKTRRHFDVVAERLEGHIRVIAEGHGVLADKIDALAVEMRTADAALDRRVTRLEAAPARRRR
ncbi:MAG: hypothetical protein AB7P99_08705 [Vicinamibacterales bacterium]